MQINNSVALNNARILLVEDDPDDVDLTIRALKSQDLNVSLDVVDNGEDALKFLMGTQPYEQRKLPDLILLDINLPKLNGHEVLQKIRSNDDLKFLPVVILTTSDSPEDILRMYNLSANCYIKKPISMHQFKEVISKIEQFWFTVVRLPKPVLES